MRAGVKVKFARRVKAAARENLPGDQLEELGVGLGFREPRDHRVGGFLNFLLHEGAAQRPVTRKGAIRAREGDLGIVPGSMGARSYIVRGKGNPESFCSSAHGAGRRMSRTAAEKQFTEADMVKQTEGVICRKDKGVIDEIPGAYKDIDVVMANQSDLTEILHTLKQVVCVKG